MYIDRHVRVLYRLLWPHRAASQPANIGIMKICTRQYEKVNCSIYDWHDHGSLTRLQVFHVRCSDDSKRNGYAYKACLMAHRY
jgi:hypothetical protein